MSQIDINTGPKTLLAGVTTTCVGATVRHTAPVKTFTVGYASGTGTATVLLFGALVGTGLFVKLATFSLDASTAPSEQFTTDISALEDFYMQVSAKTGSPVISGYLAGVV